MRELGSAPAPGQLGRRRAPPGAVCGAAGDEPCSGTKGCRRDEKRGGVRVGAIRASRLWAAALLFVCVVTHLGLGNALAQQQAHRASINAVQDLASKFAGVIRQAACDTLRTGGVGCQRPGMQDALKKLQNETKAYRAVKTRLDTFLQREILPQINGVFLNASRMIFTLRDSLEELITKGHRIERLVSRDMSLLPEWDASHPRWKNATETVINGKLFDRPVIKESSLKYPPYVSPGERRVMIAANASNGLDEFFAENILNPHNSYLRWQRFVSSTGMTRQFPGSFDNGEYDNRLAPWYKMATQTAKRIIFMLDLSGSMLLDDKIDIARTTIVTLLTSLIPEDYVNIIYIDDFQTVPKCFGNTLVPASEANINELIRFVKSSTVGAAENLIETFDKAESMLVGTDNLVTRKEKLRTPEHFGDEELTEEERLVGTTGCRQNRCTPIHEYIMVVSDGGFNLDESILKQLDAIVERRPLLHTISISVGPDKSVNEPVMTLLACRMGGLYFHIAPILSDHPGALSKGTARVSHESHILNAMGEYFQFVAAPLARNHSVINGKKYDPSKSIQNLSLDVTWSLPTMDSKREAAVITIALPCFGDSDKKTPRLLGVVAIDLLFLLPGENFGRSMISYFYDIEKNEPVDGLMDLALVFKSGYVGLSMIDSNLLYYYEAGVNDIQNFQPPETYDYLAYLGLTGDEGKRLMSRIFSEPSGLESFTLEKELPINAEQWMLEPLRFEMMDMTCAWLHLPGHPFVLVLVAKGKTDNAGLSTFMRFDPIISTPGACSPRNVSSFSPASSDDKICWDSSTRALMAFDPSSKGAREGGRSWLYINKIGYQSTASYLQTDVLALPPICSASPLACPGAERMQRLMTALNKLEFQPSFDMTGLGLTKNAFRDYLLTSLVEPLWARSLTPDSQLVQRIFISTVRGVYRTMSRPPPLCTDSGNQCPQPKIPIDLPFLYAPQVQAWYNRAQGIQGRVALTPFLAYGGNTNLIISQAVRHGYVDDADTDFGIANTAVVMGAELNFTALHVLLFGPEKLAGSHELSLARCGDSQDPNNLECFVVDQAGVLLFHSDAVLGSQGKAMYLGDHEPALMEFLVHHTVFRNVTRSSVQVSSKRQAEVIGYTLNEDILPIHLQLTRPLQGYAFLSSIPDTNTFLIAVEHYERYQEIAGCGPLSTQCPNAHFPVISPQDAQMCGVSKETVYLVSGAQPLMPEFDYDGVEKALAMMMNCPVVFPEWIQWAILTGVVSTVLGLIFMIIKYFGYMRRREQFIHNYLKVSDLQNDELGHAIVKKKPTELEKELLRVANKISNEFVTAQEMGLKARTFDDYRTIIQMQASLLDGIVERKETAREVNREKMSALATLVCNLRLLTTNLDRRLKDEEQNGAASNLQCLLAELAANDKQYKDLKEKLEALMLPTVNIDKNIDSLLDRGDSTGDEDDENAAKEKEAQKVQEEEDFYKEYYPHLIKFESQQTELEADQSSRAYDVTEMSAITERSINERAVAHSRMELRRSMAGTAVQSIHTGVARSHLIRGHSNYQAPPLTSRTPDH